MSAELPEAQTPEVPEAEPGTSYLKSVHIKGFRTIRDLETEFLPGLNVIIGENGVGKTNFLVCLESTIDLGHPGSANDADSAEGIFEINNIPFVFNVEKIENFNKHSIYKKSLNAKYSDLLIESINSFDENYKFLMKNNYIFNISIIRYGILSNIFMLDKSIMKFNINDRIIFKEASPERSMLDFALAPYDFVADIRKILKKNEKINIEELKNIIKEEIDFGISDFIESLSKYSPVKDIQLDPNLIVFVDINQGIVNVDNLLLNFQVNGQWLPYDMLSDGTKRIVYIIAKIASAPANSIILLEEPELGIHPHQLYKLMTFIKEQSKEKQIILTTHSPEVLNFIEADELDRIQIAYLKKGAGTQLRRLTAAEQEHARSYMQELDLSDFWVHAAFEENPENEVA